MYKRIARQRKIFKEGIEFTGQRGIDAVFRLHLQTSFEYIYVAGGCLNVTLDGENVKLLEGDAVLIFPNHLHSIYTPEHSDSYTIIFPGELVPLFCSRTAGCLPKSSPYRPDADINKLVTENLVEKPCDDAITLSAFVYLLCSDFIEKNELTHIEKESSYNLFASAITYMQENFSNPLTLQSLADELNVNRSHLSRVLNSGDKIGFSDYLKDFRFDKAIILLRSTDMSISEIAFSVGFNSVRSFNQCFSERANMSPSQFKKLGRL
ncbi:MAG: AraC family transcriptional regulator [Clostridiales bacterium]|nr:AraC family transcriptional regulator [Clostridiales bacterium]